MRKAKDIIGLPVVTIDTGKQVGTVKDMRIGSDWQLKAIVLESKTWFTEGRTVSSEHIAALGTDAVTVQSEEAVMQDDYVQARPLAGGSGKLFGLPVLKTNGERLGVIEDVYFGRNLEIPVVGFELSEGFVTDLQEGRKTLAIPEHAKLGEDAIVVPTDCITEAESLRISE
ncbi:PRC-barrel domain-containing protein [Paenibacillus chartarius]|uniref:PRC-barrel domain-containing protein n=1 Tax=Paenibacillus chartarius TaxID=747481 RepID=A0ABV6DIQ3_9BACL